MIWDIIWFIVFIFVIDDNFRGIFNLSCKYCVVKLFCYKNSVVVGVVVGIC